MIKALIKGALIASASIPAIALAQNNELQDLPERRALLDDNGVDLASGGISVPVAAISAGSQSFVRYQQENGWRDAVGGRVAVSGSMVTVIIADRVESFTLAGGVYTPTEVTGSTLTFSGSLYTYTAGDGTYAQFSTNYSGQAASQTGAAAPAARMTLLRAPNGEQRTYRYGAWSYSFVPYPGQPAVTLRFNRLEAITSNDGYRTEFGYRKTTASTYNDMPAWLDATSVKMFNTNIDSCPANTNGCTSAETRPSITINASGPSTTVGSYTDAAGGVTTATFSGSTLTIQAPGTPTRTYSLSSGKVTQANIAGVTTNYAYSDVGNERTTVRATAAGPETFKFYIPTAQITQHVDVFGKTTIWAYNAARQLVSKTNPETDSTVYTYDGRGNVTGTQRVGKGGVGSITTSATFDAACANFKTCNQPNTTTDARGNVTNYTYDATHGGPLTITAPPAPSGVRPETRYSYTLINGIYRLTGTSTCQTASSCAGTTDEVQSTRAFDANGNVVSATAADGAGTLAATATMTYDAVGNQLTVDGPLPGSADLARVRYDVLRRPIGEVGPDPDGGGTLKHRAMRYTYTNNLLTKTEQGTVDSQSDGAWAAFTPAQSLETQYDAYGRPAIQTLKSGVTAYGLTQVSYDPLGRPECVAQRMNPGAYGALPSSACSLGPQGSDGPDRIQKRIYDAAGRLTKVQSALGTTDQSDEVTQGYSDNGMLTSATDAEGNKTSYEYDGFDRLTITRYPVATVAAGTSSTTDYEQLGYDPNGNVTSRRLRDGQTITFGYDNLNRLVSKDLPGLHVWEFDVTYAYDNLSRMTSAINTNTHAVRFTYDALGRRLSEASDHFGTKTFQYDLAGRRTRMTWRDGFYVDYDYNTTGDVTAVRENGASSGLGVLASYAYDNLGHRTSITRGNGTVTSYSYDSASRLASLTQDLAGSAYDFTHGFTYNPAGQIASLTRSNDSYAWQGHYNIDRPYAVNGLNQLTTAGATSLGYDARGNLSSSGPFGYGYTSENYLASSPGAHFAYDGIGRLYYNGATGTWHDYDGSNLVDEVYASTNTIRRRYVRGPGVDEPLVWYEGSGTADRRWLHADERGSIVAVSDASGGAIAVNRYDEYGIPASTNLGRFQYTGQAWIPELGMYYYKARMYSPTLGRFMQTDPIGYSDGMNWYGYVGSDPVNRVDPSGTSWITISYEVCAPGVSLTYDSDHPRNLQGAPPVKCTTYYRDQWVNDGGSTPGYAPGAPAGPPPGVGGQTVLQTPDKGPKPAQTQNPCGPGQMLRARAPDGSPICRPVPKPQVPRPAPKPLPPLIEARNSLRCELVGAGVGAIVGGIATTALAGAAVGSVPGAIIGGLIGIGSAWAANNKCQRLWR